jgi:hypothetical protein
MSGVKSITLLLEPEDEELIAQAVQEKFPDAKLLDYGR